MMVQVYFLKKKYWLQFHKTIGDRKLESLSSPIHSTYAQTPSPSCLKVR